MNRKPTALILLAIASLGLPAAKQNAPTVRVLPICITENKSILLGGDKHTVGPYLARRQLLQVRLQVISRAISHPHRCFSLQISSAMLSNGVALRLIPKQFANAVAIPPQMRYAMRAAGDLGFPVALNFLPPANHVLRIASLQGSFVVVADGTSKTFTIARVRNLLGHEIPATALPGTHLRVQVEKQRTRPNGKREKLLRLRIVGRPDILRAVVSTAAAIPKSTPAPSDIFMDIPHGLVVAIPLAQPLSANASLQLTMRIHEKFFRVPFDLKNLPLPR
ncbi:MAG: hypothetical protein HKL95_07670 [Phycisphaerae bacterium]|nr:hypothetical protein [Phycisphaerae bacterium]